MTCEDYTEGLNALMDGELSPADMAVVSAHLTSCPDCRRLLAELTKLRAALAEEFPEEDVPPEFEAKILDLLNQPATLASTLPGNIVTFKKRNFREGFAWLAATAAIAAMLTVTLFPRHDVTKDLLSVRDAALRPGFAQNMGAAAPAVTGFSLAASRSDIVAGHPAQVFAYTGADKPITLCVWAANGEPAHPVRQAVFKGMKIAYWNDGKNEYWAATTGATASLDSFVAAIAKS